MPVIRHKEINDNQSINKYLNLKNKISRHPVAFVPYGI